MSSQRYLTTGAGLLLTLLFAGGAMAAGDEPAEARDQATAEAENEEALAGAREAYGQAVQAYEQQRYKDAIDLFTKANELSPNPAFSFNIGIAYEDMGDSALALKHYREYVRLAPRASDRDDVDRRIQRLEQKLQEKGVQQVTVLSTPEGATVTIDERAVGVTPWTGEIAPGHHKLKLYLQGYQDALRDFDQPPSRAIDVPVTLLEGTTPAPSSTTPEANAGTGLDGFDDAPRRSTPGVEATTWIVLGAGIASLGAAGTFELLRSDAEKKAKTEPIQVKAKPLIDQAEEHQLMATIFVAVGGALTVTGTVLMVADLSADEDDDMAWGGGCGPSGCALTYSGTF